MRAGVSTVQHTLTAEAASILKQAVSDAFKRGHAQATPLHVAATLLLSPSSPLRRACLQTQPHPSQLPQCRALELCFNIALERLQAAQGPLPNGQPSYSNALVAALKRAQAHQRRGCPEQQQQPLLAVKVELEQLVISILDDPSVSRVMREAGFSSTDVKNHLEEMVSLMASHHSGITDPVRLPLGSNAMDQIGFRLGGVPPSILGGFPFPHQLTNCRSGSFMQDRNDLQFHRTYSSYTNPVFVKPGLSAQICSGGEEIKHVMEVFLRKTTRNPVLLGDSALRVEAALKDVIQLMERGSAPEQLRGVKVVSANMSFVTLINATKEDLKFRFMELNKTVQELVLGGGVVLNMGNLQWLLQVRASSNQLTGFCPVEHAAHEIKELFTRYCDTNRIWLIGSATNQTYRSCLSLYPALDSQWGLHPISIGQSATSGFSPRVGCQDSGIDTLALSLCPSAGATLQASMARDFDGEKLTCCSECQKKYEKEALLLQGQDGCRQPDSPQSCSSSVEIPSKSSSDQGRLATGGSQPALPLWLHKALPEGSKRVATSSVEVYDKPVPLPARLRELQKKWNQICKLHCSDCVSGREVPLEISQQPSSLPNEISGSDQIPTLLRENFIHSGIVRPASSSVSGQNDHHFSRSVASTLTVSSMQNGISEQFLQLRAHKDRVQEDSIVCNAPVARFPFSATSAAMRCTEAAVPCSIPDRAIFGQPSRLLMPMNPEDLGQLCKGLAKKVGWQPRIISTIASTVLQCRSGLTRRSGAGVSCKGDTWLLFLGYDKPGKRLMAEALAELSFCEQSKPVLLTFGDKQQDMGSPATWSLGLTAPPRGKMPLDQLADAIRHNPSSLFYLENVEQAESMVRASLLRAMTKGRLLDSSGRDVSLGSAIIVMTSSAGTEASDSKCTISENQVQNESSLSLNEYSNRMGTSPEHWLVNKRRGTWEVEGDCLNSDSSRNSKRANIGKGLDLNLSLAAVEEKEDAAFSGSHSPVQDSDSSRKPELRTEEVLLGARKRLGELCDLVDAAVVFSSS